MIFTAFPAPLVSAANERETSILKFGIRNLNLLTPNTFITNLAELCGQHLLAEKWLLAPNRRVGNQWVEQVARSGQPAVNLRVTTVRSLVMEMAGAAPAVG